MATWKKKKKTKPSIHKLLWKLRREIKKAFMDFLILALGEKFIWLEWIVKLANTY